MTRSRPYSQPQSKVSAWSSPRTHRAFPPVSCTVTLPAAAGGSAAAFTQAAPHPALWPWVTIIVILIILLIVRRPVPRGLTVSARTACSVRVTRRLKITSPVT
jgi:hypothetical protein